jgi:hypothetical protein
MANLWPPILLADDKVTDECMRDRRLRAVTRSTDVVNRSRLCAGQGSSG